MGASQGSWLACWMPLPKERRSANTSEPKFTERENQVLQLLVAGRANREIAQALGIDSATVKARVLRLMRKMGVDNRIAFSVAGGKSESCSEVTGKLTNGYQLGNSQREGLYTLRTVVDTRVCQAIFFKQHRPGRGL